MVVLKKNKIKKTGKNKYYFYSKLLVYPFNLKILPIQKLNKLLK
jgi:hypothetical protein